MNPKKDDVITANPMAELSVPSAKYAANCKNLHLGGKNIEKLGQDFPLFESLESLWLNNNKLDQIHGLESNVRLKSLYLHHNNLVTLPDELLNFKFLHDLTLNDNKLTNLNIIINGLKNLTYLVTLNLFNNPCEKEDNYRLLLIGNLPHIQILDRHQVTPTERQQAKELLVKLNKLQASILNSNSKSRTPAYEDEETIQRRNEMKHNMLARIRYMFKTKRMAFERDCADIDKRHVNIIPTQEFWKILKDYIMYDSIAPDERELIEKLYTEHVLLDSVSAMKLPYSGINYRKFCDSVDLPPELRRNTAPTKPHKKISDTTLELENYVNRTIRHNKKVAEDEWKRKTAVTLDDSATPSVSGVTRTLPCESLQHGLQPWIAYEISSIIKKYEQDGSNKLSYANLCEIFEKIRLLGYEPKDASIEDTIARFIQPNSNASVVTDLLREAIGCCAVRKASAKGSLVKGQSGIDASKSRKSSPRSNNSVESIPSIVFKNVLREDAIKLQEVEYSNASKFMEQILRSNANNRADGDLMRRTIDSSIHGTRLENAFKTKRTVQKVLLPDDIIRNTKSIRCDTLIIPHLRPKTSAEGFDENSWKEHLKGLGLRGELLALAIERKRRTNILQERLRVEQESIDHTHSNLRSVSIDQSTGGTMMSKSQTARSKSSIKPRFTWEKGWGSDTGVVVFDNSYKVSRRIE